MRGLLGQSLSGKFGLAIPLIRHASHDTFSPGGEKDQIFSAMISSTIGVMITAFGSASAASKAAVTRSAQA